MEDFYNIEKYWNFNFRELSEKSASSSAMAGLGCGSYRFSNSVNNNKAYVYVKLTESAHKALEEYLKIRVSDIYRSIYTKNYFL